MKQPYLEITFRHGQPLAAYLYLPREGNEKSARTKQAAPGLLIDFSEGDRPIGLEITAPGRVSASTINRILADLGFSPLSDADLAPLRAAESPLCQRDLDDIAGAWQEDPEFDQAVADQDQIDERLWR